MSARLMFRDHPIPTAADFAKLPGYVDVIDHTKEEFEDVISHHHFPTMARCSIRGCRQQYKDGFLLQWKSGSISNVGHCCAQKYLGDLFTSRLERYRSEAQIPRLQEQVRHFKQSLPQFRAYENELGGDAKNLVAKKFALTMQFPLLQKELERSSNSGYYDVRQTKEIFEPELDENGKPTGKHKRRYETVPIGRIHGLEFLSQHVMLIFTEKIGPTLDRLERADIHSLSIQALSDLYNDASALDEQFSVAKRLIRAGSELFSPEAEALIRRIQGNRPLESECRRYSLGVLKEGPLTPRTVSSVTEKPPSGSVRRRGWRR